MRTPILILILLGLLSILPLGCAKEPNTSDVNQQSDMGGQSGNEAIDISEVSPEVKAIFERLNDWGIEEIDVFECPDKYPLRITSGETNGWISVHKKRLKELGFTAEWKCDRKVYELFKIPQ